MKDKSTAALLAFFLGGIGIHRFYLGQPFIGLMYLFFCWTFIPAVVGFIDFIVFLIRSDESFNKEYNKSKPYLHLGSVADELAKLHKLKTDGVISEEEFNRKKATLI